MQIVNGYICMNCCDVDKARLGQDPHQSADQIQKQIDRQLHPMAPQNFGPAVTFGGSLQTTAFGQDTSGNGSRASGIYAAGPGTNLQLPANAGTGAGSKLNLVV